MVTATDPNRYFFGGPVPQIWPNTTREKIQLFRAYSARGAVTGLLFGSSRSALIRSDLADSLTGLRFFNASCYDSSIENYLALYRLFRKTQPEPPKTLILGLEPELLSSTGEMPRDLVASYPLMSQIDSSLTLPWHYARVYALYFRTQTFIDLATSLKNWRSPKPPLDKYFADGHIESADPTLERHLVKERLQDDLVEYRDFHEISGAHVEHLRSLLREASADHVRILLWITPIHPLLRAAIDRLPEVPEELQRSRKLIMDMGSEFHTQTADLSAPESYGGDPSGWLDGVHPSAADSQLELNHLLTPTQN